MAIITSGKYIKNKFSLCHKPSFAKKGLENSGLSDITNKTKKISEATKQNRLDKPRALSSLLNEINEERRGTKRKSINPKAEAAP